jgi:hypothetical protein
MKQILMGKFIVIVLLSIVQLNVQAQVTDINWLQSFSGNGNFVKVAIDAESNIYAGINFEDKTDFNPVIIKGYPAIDNVFPNNKTGVIIKMDKAGKILWHRYISQFWIADFTLNQAGEVIVSGDGWLPGAKYTLINSKSPVQKRGVYLLKINKKAEIEVLYKAEHAFSDPEGPYGLIVPVLFKAGAVVVKRDNEIYWANIFMDKGYSEVANIALLDTSGHNIKKQFFKHKPVNSNIGGNIKLALDGADNLYVGGSYLDELRTDGRLDFANDYPLNGGFDGEDSYVIKFDKDQQLSWKTKVGGQGTQHIHSMVIKDTLLYVAGSFNNAGCFISNGDVIVSSEQKRIQGGDNSFLLALLPDGTIERVDYYMSHNAGANEGLASFKILAAEPVAKNRLLVSGNFVKDITYDDQKITYPVKTNYNMLYGAFYGLTDKGTVKALNKFNGYGIVPDQIKVSGDMAIMAGYYGAQPGAGIAYNGKFKEFDKEPDRTYAGGRGYIMSVKMDPALYDQSPATNDPVNLAANARYTKDSSAAILSTDGPYSLVHPNPSAGLVNLELHNLSGETHIVIYNVAGQTVFSYTGTISGTKEQIGLDLSRLAPGVYFTHVINGSYKKTHKVVKL